MRKVYLPTIFSPVSCSNPAQVLEVFEVFGQEGQAISPCGRSNHQIKKVFVRDFLVRNSLVAFRTVLSAAFSSKGKILNLGEHLVYVFFFSWVYRKLACRI
ncbi:hypothetical protein, partial [Allomeiothermus silvanus]|uniref:hypothetical protein n=1 Tax=Allomeiothermus silvanus TaxID=52022 RepID=UPI0023F4C87D